MIFYQFYKKNIQDPTLLVNMLVVQCLLKQLLMHVVGSMVEKQQMHPKNLCFAKNQLVQSLVVVFAMYNLWLVNSTASSSIFKLCCFISKNNSCLQGLGGKCVVLAVILIDEVSVDVLVDADEVCLREQTDKASTVLVVQ